MSNRDMVKWLPFNSVVNSKEMISSLLKEREKRNKPVLSDEEKEIIEHIIMDAYFSKQKVNITYYSSGSLKKVNGCIKKIDQIYKMIYLDNLRLLFSQIISITLE